MWKSRWSSVFFILSFDRIWQRYRIQLFWNWILIWTVYCYCNKWKKMLNMDLTDSIICYCILWPCLSSAYIMWQLSAPSIYSVLWSLYSAVNISRVKLSFFTLGPFKREEYLLWLIWLSSCPVWIYNICMWNTLYWCVYFILLFCNRCKW